MPARFPFQPPAGLSGVCLVLVLLSVTAPACREAPRSSADADNRLVHNRGEGKDEWWSQLPRAAWSEFESLGERQGWFEVYRIRPGIFAIYEPGQFEEVISYLIEGSERALLFDTGLGIGDIRSVVEELTELPVAVLNSHTHYDHVGDNYSFDEIYGTATDYTKRSAAGRGPEELAEFVGEGWIWKPTPPGFDRTGYRGRPFVVTRVIEDGEALDLGGRSIEILLTPGHAPDSLCLLDRQKRLLFTGDTYYPAPLYAHLEGSSFAQYRQTAHRLAEIASQVDFVLPAHNEPLISSEVLVDMKRAFDAIAEGDADYRMTDGNREYHFAGITVLTPPELDL